MYLVNKFSSIYKLYTYSTARSPLYSHISSTIQGLSTIRAYKEEEKFSIYLHHYLNEHTKAWYLYLATNRWFGMRIDLISAAFLATVVLSAIPLADSKYDFFIVKYMFQFKKVMQDDGSFTI